MWPGTHAQKKIAFQTFWTLAINNSCLQRYICWYVNTCWADPKKSTKSLFTICQQVKIGRVHYFLSVFRSVLLTIEWFSKRTSMLTCYWKPTGSKCVRSTGIFDNSPPKIYLLCTTAFLLCISKPLENYWSYLEEEQSSEEQAAYFFLRHLSTSKPVVLRTLHLAVPINPHESYQGPEWRGWIKRW